MRNAVTIVLASVGWLTVAPAARAEPPVGDWRMPTFGPNLTLVIRCVGPDGRLEGALLGRAINGKWDPASQKVTFASLTENGNMIYSFEGRLRRVSCGRTATYVLEGTYNLNWWCYPVDEGYWGAWSAQLHDAGPRGR